MKAHFTQSTPDSSSRWAVATRAFFVASLAFVGLAGTANAQLGANINAGAPAPATSTTTVTDYIAANPAGTFGQPTTLTYSAPTNTTMAVVGNTAPVSGGYQGASGANYISFPTGKGLTIRTIQTDALTQVVLKFSIYVPVGGSLAGFSIQYGFGNGNSNNANINQTLALPVITPGEWTRIERTIVYTNNQQSNMALQFINNGISTVRIDDINAVSYNTACTITAGQVTWKGIGSDFNVASNWCPEVVPGPNDIAVINTGSTTTIQVTANTSVYKLVVQNAGTSTSTLPLQLNSGVTLNVGAGGLDLSANLVGAATELKTSINSILAVTGPAAIATTGSGSVAFTSTSTIDNPAFIKFGGNLTSGSLTNPTTSLNFAGNRVEFNGTANQQILGNGTLTFQHLKVNNTGAANANLVEYGSAALNITVNGNLEFVSGVFQTSDNVVNYGTAATIAETNTSYFNGNLNVLARPVTSVDQDFGGLGITLSATAAGAPFSTSIARNTGLAVSGANGSVSILRSFDIDVANAPADLGATMKFNFFEHELNSLAPAQLVFFRQGTGALGLWENKGITSIVAPTLANNNRGVATLTGIKAFSKWTLGSTVTPLPVELISYAAKRNNDAAVLEWSTASEDNNAGYQIEVSSDSRNYETIGFINAMQTGKYGAEYSFVDPKANVSAVRYYRLTQHDLDGTVTVLGVRSVSFESKGISLTTGPNPFTYGFAALVESDRAQSATVTLTDALGRVIDRQETKLMKGVNQIDFNGYELSKGMYMLSVELETEVLTTKVNKL